MEKHLEKKSQVVQLQLSKTALLFALCFRDKEFYEKEFLELKNIDRAECLKPFEAWSAKEDKILY